MLIISAIIAKVVTEQQAFDIVPYLTPGALVVAGAIAGIVTLWNRRGGERARRMPSWVELDEANRLLRSEISELSESFDAKLKQVKDDCNAEINKVKLEHDKVVEDLRATNQASARVIRNMVHQWDGNPPTLHTADIHVLEATIHIPSTWRQNSANN